MLLKTPFSAKRRPSVHGDNTGEVQTKKGFDIISSKPHLIFGMPECISRESRSLKNGHGAALARSMSVSPGKAASKEKTLPELYR